MTWLRERHLKRTYIQATIGISSAVLDRILYGDHVPKPATVNALAAMLGVKPEQLLVRAVKK